MTLSLYKHSVLSLSLHLPTLYNMLRVTTVLYVMTVTGIVIVPYCTQTVPYCTVLYCILSHMIAYREHRELQNTVQYNSSYANSNTVYFFYSTVRYTGTGTVQYTEYSSCLYVLVVFHGRELCVRRYGKK